MNPFEMLKNVQQLKDKSKDFQKQLEAITATGSAGGRMVNVTLNGKFEMIDIELDPICVDNRDIQMLRDLILAAYKDALSNVSELVQDKTKEMLGGLDLSSLGL